MESLSKRFVALTILFLLVLPLASAGIPSVKAVTGSEHLAIILAEFPDVPHHQSIEHYTRDILPQVTGYYNEVSYQRYQLDGHVLGWFTLQKPLSDFNVTNRGAPDRGKLLLYTFSSVDSFIDFKNYDRILIVYTGGVWAFETDIRNYLYPGSLGYKTQDGTYVTQVGVTEENDLLWVFIHELGHTLGLPDLYDYDTTRKATFIGVYDIMGSAQYPVHFSAWSKIRLGWIPQSEVAQIELGTQMPAPIVPLVPLELNASGIHVIRITSPRISQYYLVELRLRTGYDTNLPGSGVLVTYVDEKKGSGQGIVTLRPNSKGETYELAPNAENVFIENQFSFSVIILKEGPDAWAVTVSTIEDGIVASRTAAALFEAAAAIQQAKAEIRTDGLNAAEETLASGWAAYAARSFASAESHAANSVNLAMKAVHPPAYLTARSAIEEVKVKLANTRQQSFNAPLARILLLEAAQEIQQADVSLSTGDFSSVTTYVGNADNLIAQALQAEREYNNPSQERPATTSAASIEISGSILIMAVMAFALILLIGVVTIQNRRRISSEKPPASSAKHYCPHYSVRS